MGYTTELRRTAIGSVSIDKANQLADITNETIGIKLVSILDILPELEKVILSEAEFAVLRMGRKIDNLGADQLRIVLLDEKSDCRGIGFRKENTLYPKVNL